MCFRRMGLSPCSHACCKANHAPWKTAFQASDKGTPMSITVYSTPACVQCAATTRALMARNIAFELVDLSKDAEAMARVTELGYRQAPVVMTSDDHWAGFRPDKINALS